MSQSVGGTTFQLNGLAQNSVRFPTLSYDSIKRSPRFQATGGSRRPNSEQLFHRHAHQDGHLRDRQHALHVRRTIRRDRVSSYGHWLSDRADGPPLYQSKGHLRQSETPLSDVFRVVLAGRYDKHDKYDAQFSPKAALMFTPITDQTFRVTYNKAFKSPSVLQTDSTSRISSRSSASSGISTALTSRMPRGRS